VALEDLLLKPLLIA